MNAIDWLLEGTVPIGGGVLALPLADAWILTGSILATYGMARGWTDFWLIWIAVDAVGVPLLIDAGYYPSAALYGLYGLFCAIGFTTWVRVQRKSHGERELEVAA